MKLEGKISVGIFFIESSVDGGDKYEDKQRTRIFNQLKDGLDFLKNQHPSGNLSFIVKPEPTIFKIDVKEVNATIGDEPNYGAENQWLWPAIAQLTIGTTTYAQPIDRDALNTTLGDYCTKLKTQDSSDYAVTIFVTPFDNNWHAYASHQRFVISRVKRKRDGNNNDDLTYGGIGVKGLDSLCSHEMCHLFGAKDEYIADYNSHNDPNKVYGDDRIPHGNTGDSLPNISCLMKSSKNFFLCDYTKGQIGWSHLFVEIYTSSIPDAGTDDRIWLDIGEKEYLLDYKDTIDKKSSILFRKGCRNGFAIWDPELKASDIKRVIIRKEKDGAKGGYNLDRVVLRFKSFIIYESETWEQNINTWLQNGKLYWYGGLINLKNDTGGRYPFDKTLVHTILVNITTSDIKNAGTNDNIFLHIGDRCYLLDNAGTNDFEKGKTSSFNLYPGIGLRFSDLNNLKIVKEGDGDYGEFVFNAVTIFANGLVIFNHANSDIVLDPLTPDFIIPNEQLVRHTPQDIKMVRIRRLIVEIKTKDIKSGGTDDQVYFSMNGLQWALDNKKDNFERGDLDIFDLDPRGLHIIDQITGFSITKEKDGSKGGWYCESIRIRLNSQTYDVDVKQWFEDDVLNFTSEIKTIDILDFDENPDS